MPDPFYPSVDIDFIIHHVKASGKLAEDGIIKVGSTTTFVQEGTSAIAFKFGFLIPIGEWLEKNRHWKDGAYIVPPTR